MTEDVKGDEATDTVADDTAEETVEETAAADTEAEEIEESEGVEEPALTSPAKRGIQWSRLVAFVVLPALALVLAAGAGYLKWLDDTNRAGTMSAEPTSHPSLAETTVQAAREGTIALLSYTPDKVEEQLGAARDLLTGEFRESYTSLTNDVVIPGAREKQISAIATVPAAASVSLSSDEAVVLLFVNQTVTVGQDPPTDTASSVRVTLEKVDHRWLISQFDPV
ncbi:hypothetical protein [Mycolicibacterium iranicum]|uniref:Twin-arginine translocation pathway signal n=1 Tax=Mycolicibacterium iranicum TaxID=912594 RepID=A0A1X1WKV2_MYCIR|nr:hypothetical protein [Mycolicibacterium iranicum]MCZ0730759.1 hypothetical protein [Mycolicibacterium iranicum]ORV87112.1 hypothetical protein AWC12_18255 [Mycolicibacterium iranicum]